MADISKIQTPDNTEYNIKDANVPHSSLTAASGGTDLSLVTTGEKYNWNGHNKVRLNTVDIYNYGDEFEVGYFYYPSEWVTRAGKVYLKSRIKCTVYERTIAFSDAVTISAGNNSAAGAWTSLPGSWTDDIIVLDFYAYSWSGNDRTYLGHFTAQWSRSGECIKVLNVRSTAQTINGYTIRYCFFPSS